MEDPHGRMGPSITSNHVTLRILYHPRNTTTMPTSGFMERSLAALAELVREGGGPEVIGRGGGG